MICVSLFVERGAARGWLFRRQRLRLRYIFHRVKWRRAAIWCCPYSRDGVILEWHRRFAAAKHGINAVAGPGQHDEPC